MDVYGTCGQRLGRVPQCPQKTLPRPFRGEDYTADGAGNLYQMQILNPGDAAHGGGYVSLWKWSKIQ